MANDTKSVPTFNHTQDAAPEYVDVILWHRVVLALGALVVTLAGSGYLLYGWMQDENPANDLEVMTISPNDLEPTAAIPAPAPAPASTPSSVTPVADSDQSSAAESSATADHSNKTVSKEAATKGTKNSSMPARPAVAANDVASSTATSNTVTPKPAAPNTAKPQEQPKTGTQLALLEQAPAAAKNIGQSVTQDTSSADRHQVQTEILMPAVKRAVLTTLIHQREPGKPLQSTAGLSMDETPLSLHQFIEIQGRSGDNLTYTWKHNGKEVTKVKVAVGADKWRTFGSKAFHANQQGQWEVSITDNRDRLLARTRFYLGA